MSEAESMSSKSTFDPYAYLEIVLNSDGSITRNPNRFPNASPTPDPYSDSPVLSKDIFINQSNGTWVRIYLPRQAPDLFPSHKLPLLVYFHGGGFIVCSASTALFHNFCVDIALELQVAIVSVDYRLSPEHRLPAAYDDCVEALHWIRTTDDEWLKKYVDLSNCFLMGSSAGGNIVYHVGLRVAPEANQFEPLKIQGLILHHPFFGGVQRCESELKKIDDPMFPPCAADVMWELSLPIGVDRDHEYANPVAGGGSKQLDRIKQLGWRVFVIGCDGDPTFDRQIEFGKLMEEKGIQMVGHYGVGGYHGVELIDPTSSKAKELKLALKFFMLE